VSTSRPPHTRHRARGGAALSKAEAELWQAWKHASDSVISRVEHDIAEATGLSGADYGVLSQLVELGRGKLRQQELADSLSWHKSRLSHHLSRMEARALVRRTPAKTNVVLVAITASGKQALRSARPGHARSVRAHLTRKVLPAERKHCLALLIRLDNE
jgi:DNA-binding MarR family transcriptional regulator